MFIFNAVYPAINRSSGAMVSVASKLDHRIKSQIRIVHATGELDQNQQWQDTNGDGDFDVFLWVKNVGASRLVAVEETDVFFGKEASFVRVPHLNEAGGTFPYWTFQIENDTEWKPTATLKITIHDTAPCTPPPCDAPGKAGTYFLRVVAPNGVSDELFFSM